MGKSNKSNKISKIPESQKRTPDEWWHDAWLETYTASGNVGLACRSVSIARKTAYAHREMFPDFAEKWDEAKESHTDDLEEMAARRALIAGSDRMLIFLLRSRRPEIYREAVELTGRDGAPLQSSPGVVIILPSNGRENASTNKD
jgi:hypothetical protein